MNTKLHLVLVLVLVAIGAVYTVKPFSNSNDARNALQAQGFTDIETTGWSPFACGEDDFYSTGFIATNAQGMRVKGTVCSGILFKNSTIRW